MSTNNQPQTTNSQFYGDSIFWIEIEKIIPNPYQPRKEFDDAKLKDLAESIRMYGILQPLVVTRKEIPKPDGGLAVEYELISGERRLRASKIAGLSAVPTLIRSGQDSAREKLELAIIENLQREDLNPVDRARSFERLANEFGLKHSQIAEKVGKSREYVSNTMRILVLPEEILNALSEGKISEGHTRPLLMLTDRPEEQITLYKEIIYKKLTVRETEAIARKIAHDKVRKKDKSVSPEIIEIEAQFKESLGTRVHIEPREQGGRVTIDFFNENDLRTLLNIVSKGAKSEGAGTMQNVHGHISSLSGERANTDIMASAISGATPVSVDSVEKITEETIGQTVGEVVEEKPIDDRSPNEVAKENDEDSDKLYSVSGFNI